MTPEDRSRIVHHQAELARFDRCGIAPAQPIGRADYLHAWLAAGRGGSMDYLSRRLDMRRDPRSLLEGARSIIVVALLYYQPEPPTHTAGEISRSTESPTSGPSPGSAPTTAAEPSSGRIARYAWGEDYHEVLKDRLFAFARALRERLNEPFGFKVCVDTAPIVEREVAALAGIGWIGKNTMVLHEQIGSFFFLGELITTLALAADEPAADHCGSCTACLDACPTAAFPAPYEMDASRCVSYLTIEHRGDIDASLANGAGDWLFGCDVCQEVCPFNRRPPTTREPRFAPRPPAPRAPLDDVLRWTPEDYRGALRGTAMKRATLAMWQRNARLVQDNQSR